MTDNRFEELPMMKLKIICILSAIICVSISGNCHAGATMVNGTEFSNSVEVRGTRLQLSGAALLRYMFLIEAYTGALYLPEKTDGPNALDDISKHLILEYRVALSSDDFAKATMEKIKGSVSKEAFQRLLPKIKALNRLYKDVQPKDRYALTYLPGVGTQLTLNAEPLGTIEGSEFARAVFAIWIGKNPIDKTFRDRLLGKSK